MCSVSNLLNGIDCDGPRAVTSGVSTRLGARLKYGLVIQAPLNTRLTSHLHPGASNLHHLAARSFRGASFKRKIHG